MVNLEYAGTSIALESAQFLDWFPKGNIPNFKALRQIVYYRKALKEKRKKEVPEKALLSTGYFSKIHRCC